MIGTLKPDKMELVIKDYQYYKMYYCSICRHLVRNNVRIYSFLTGYEGTLMAMLYNELVTRNIDAVKDRCSGVPLVKVPVLPENHEAVELGAYICLLAFQAKFQDDLLDETGFWISHYNRYFQNHIQKSFQKKNGTYSKFNIDLEWVKTRQEELKKLENDPSLKDSSRFLNHWGETFSYIMTQPLNGKIEPHRLKAFQRFFAGLGRLINLLDAMTDLHEDRTTNRFNPILQEENSEPPLNEDALKKWYMRWEKKVRKEQMDLLDLFPVLALRESLPIIQNILTHCLDKALKKVFESMVLKKKQVHQTLFNCQDF